MLSFDFLRLSRGRKAPPRDPQVRPVACGPGADAPRLKVEFALDFDGALLVAGWCSGPLELTLMRGRQVLAAERTSVPRGDVAQHFGLAQADVGFALRLPALPAARAGRAAAPISLHWRHPIGGQSAHAPLHIEPATPANAARWGSAGAALLALARRYPAFDPRWCALVAHCPDTAAPADDLAGHVERALVSEVSGQGLATGWLVAEPDACVWLQTAAGTLLPMRDARRHFRADAFQRAEQLALNALPEAGFTLPLQGAHADEPLRLRALLPRGLVGLGVAQCEALPHHPLEATRRLVEIDPSNQAGAERIAALDGALLAPLIALRRTHVAQLPVESIIVGTLPAAPVASVIVPLYGRRDFAEHQLLALEDDAAFARHCELIYVIDDPQLLEGWREHAQQLERNYGVPMRWVWGGANRGFAGASNLGAQFAQGRHLIFLNSDVFPRKAGWAERLAAVLDTDASVGAVGPRLLYADGSIQHAGMEFQYRGDLGIWINHHPSMGLAPELDPHRQLTRVDAVTGACLAVRRSDFERVGGWDSGYLVGDFEDSDLCLKLAELGLATVYLPQVELTHLERQSVRGIGDARLRRFVTMYNAVRHQQRWPQRLAVH